MAEWSSSCADSNVLMTDPFVDYINRILMDEGMEDAPSLQQVEYGDVSTPYQAIFSSLQNIIAESSASSNSNYNTSAIQSSNGLLADHAMISCSGKLDAVVQGNNGQEEGMNVPLKLHPSAHEPYFSSQLAALDLSFEDLKLDDVYTSLYVEERRSSTTAAGNPRYKRNSVAARYKSEVDVFVDVREILLSCAQAVAIGEARRANEALQELYQVCGASARGTGPQRVAHIFAKALAARMRGTGAQEYKAMSLEMPSSAEVLRASRMAFEVSPYIALMHYFANGSILKAAEGASRLHILDYGLLYGLQWPCLINALADRKGGPPLLVITAIELPQPGTDMEARLDECGRRLAAYAKTYNVPFQYHAIVTDKWEDLDAASLVLHSEGEVLVVNCMKRLRHFSDDRIDMDSPNSARQKLLTCWHSLNPHLLVTAVTTAAFNSPFFVSRFREALSFYYNVFDMLDTLWGDIPERLIIERSSYYRNIMNLVACEGAERVERGETYKQWHAYITKAGFEQLPIPAAVMARSKAHVKQHYHRDFLIYEDDEKGWMLMCWKGRAMLAISAWSSKPSRLPVM